MTTAGHPTSVGAETRHPAGPSVRFGVIGNDLPFAQVPVVHAAAVALAHDLEADLVRRAAWLAGALEQFRGVR